MNPLPFFLAIVTLSPLAQLGAQPVNWPVPQAPAGENPAAFATPRNDWMTKFQANLERSRQGGIDLLFIGDSITEGWKRAGQPAMEQAFGKERAVSFGIAGDRTENILWRLRNGELDGISPRLIVVLAGTNNVARDTVGEIEEGVRAIVEECKSRCASAHVLLLGIFPRGDAPDGKWRVKLAEVSRRLASRVEGDKRVTFLDIGSIFLEAGGALRRDLMPDALHPNQAGYEAWAGAIRPEVARHLDVPGR